MVGSYEFLVQSVVCIKKGIGPKGKVVGLHLQNETVDVTLKHSFVKFSFWIDFNFRGDVDKFAYFALLDRALFVINSYLKQ